MRRWYVLLAAFAGCTGPSDAPFDTSSDTGDVAPIVPWDRLPWVRIDGGAYDRGSPPTGPAFEQPLTSATVETFYLARTEVTIGEYLACMQDGACPDPPVSQYCVVPETAVASRVMNCLDWYAASDVCAWSGGRLPSETEWEFAARSRGKDHEFPWGNEPFSCSNAVHHSCGSIARPATACSRPDGNTEQGLCDMAGNAFEWVQDWFRDTYDEHPTDGSANELQLFEFRTMRGGGINSDADYRTRTRTFHPPDFHYGAMGVRCARDVDALAP